MSVDAARLSLCITDLANVSLRVLDPAQFTRYTYLSAAFVTVEQLRCVRIVAAVSDAGEVVGHKLFWNDGTEKRFVEVKVARKGDGDGAVARAAAACGLRDPPGAESVLIFNVFLVVHTHMPSNGFTPRWLASFCGAEVDDGIG